MIFAFVGIVHYRGHRISQTHLVILILIRGVFVKRNIWPNIEKYCYSFYFLKDLFRNHNFYFCFLHTYNQYVVLLMVHEKLGYMKCTWFQKRTATPKLHVKNGSSCITLYTLYMLPLLYTSIYRWYFLFIYSFIIFCFCFLFLFVLFFCY